MTKEEMIIAAERYAHEQTGRDCRWADCEFCWVYRSDVPCKHREMMLRLLAKNENENENEKAESGGGY